MSKKIIADQESIRRINSSLVLNTLRLHSPLTRAELASITKLNRSTISNIINCLLEDDLVVELNAKESKGGRPGIALSLKPDGGAIIGVEIGVGFIFVILTDFVANTLWKQQVNFSLSKTQLEIISETESLIEQAITFAKKKKLHLLGIGVGVPGLVNAQKGELLFAPNLSWRNVPLRMILNQRFNIPVFVENEANLGALGEYYFGVGRNVENFAYLSSGIGLGAGLIINGNLYKGGFGLAGEIGHIQYDPQGELCGCGRRGCWETVVGPRAVLRRVKRLIEAEPNHNILLKHRTLDDLNIIQVVNYATEGDPLCVKAIKDVAKDLGMGIADLCNIFNPEMIIIGGIFTHGQEIMLPVIKEVVLSETMTNVYSTLKIVFSEHGADACVLGAIAIVLDNIFRKIVLVEE